MRPAFYLLTLWKCGKFTKSLVNPCIILSTAKSLCYFIINTGAVTRFATL